jgi:hypothetical protein
MPMRGFIPARPSAFVRLPAGYVVTICFSERARTRRTAIRKSTIILDGRQTPQRVVIQIAGVLRRVVIIVFLLASVFRTG